MIHFFEKKQKGFTLMEILVYMGLFSIVLFSIIIIYFQILSTKNKTEAIQSTNQEAQFIMKRISDAIYNAQSVTAPGQGISTDTLTLSMYDPAQDPTTFEFSSGNILFSQAGSDPVSLNSEKVQIQEIVFTNTSYPNTPDSIQVRMTMKTNTSSLLREYIFQDNFITTITLRPK